MQNKYVETAENIKLIMAVGFGFNEACKVYKLVDQKIENSENLEYINEIFEIGEGETLANECYEHYLLWCDKKGIEAMTLTKFGIVTNKFIGKVRKNKGNFYNCTLR